jgi:hypothetical protein
MKPFYQFLKNLLLPAFFLLVSNTRISAQACAAASGDNQNTYGISNTWIGYIYTGQNFNNYQGHVTEGSTTSPNFYETFGGSSVAYTTSSCSITTDNFSARYRLSQALTGSFTITVGGDDGYRLSIDGGSTWLINNWGDHGYATSSATVNLSGTTNFVLEYYENGGDNIVSFNMVQNCSGIGDQTIYGSGNIWNGYIYQGRNFDTYKGLATEGSTASPNFDENFGNTSGSNTNTYFTNSCYVQTSNFSARYRLTQTLTPQYYVFTVGGDDGYRFSLDGGNTWAINNFTDHAYTSTTYTQALSGTVNMVIEYYQGGGYDRVSFVQTSSPLPVTITTWSVGALDKNQAKLKWTTTDAVDFDHFVIQRSTDGTNFDDIQIIAANNDNNYTYIDQDNWNGKLYYRLVTVDRDGKTNYSNIISISLQAAQSLRIYPTMVETGNFFVETSKPIQQAKLELFDMNGRRIQENNFSLLEGRQLVAISNRASMPAGAYIVRLSNEQNILAKQIIVIK